MGEEQTTLEGRQTEKAKKLLLQEAEKFFKQFKIGLIDALNDKFSPEEVFSKQQKRSIVLAYLIRDAFEQVNDELGEQGVRWQFEATYYRIASRKIGGDDFVKNYEPPILTSSREDSIKRLNSKLE